MALEEKVHYVAVTGIIRKDGKYLICKRSEEEKVFPGKWCVPGGKLEQKDFINEPKDTRDHWFDVIERGLRREVREETGLEITNINYVSNLALLLPNGFSMLIISMRADYDSGKLQLDPRELIEHAWVTLEEAKSYDLIENIYEQMQKAEESLYLGAER